MTLWQTTRDTTPASRSCPVYVFFPLRQTSSISTAYEKNRAITAFRKKDHFVQGGPFLASRISFYLIHSAVHLHPHEGVRENYTKHSPYSRENEKKLQRLKKEHFSKVTCSDHHRNKLVHFWERGSEQADCSVLSDFERALQDLQVGTPLGWKGRKAKG